MKNVTPKGYGFNYTNALLTIAVLIIFSFSARYTGFKPLEFIDPNNIKGVNNFVQGLWPPETSPSFLADIGKMVAETIAISIVGTILAIIGAIPLAIFATRVRGEEFSRKSRGTLPWLLRWSAYYMARMILNIFRGIPELMWALIFIVAVGLGPFPGVLALAAHSTGILGKLYSEILETVDQNIVESARSTGISELTVLAFVKIPASLPILLSYTLFRWECNMRAATVLGFVGAGGIGTQLTISMQLFNYSQVSTLILVILALVVFVDLVGQFIRTRLLDYSVSCEKEI